MALDTSQYLSDADVGFKPESAPAGLMSDADVGFTPASHSTNLLSDADVGFTPPATEPPSLLSRAGSALKSYAEKPTATHAFATGFGEGFQEGAPIGESFGPASREWTSLMQRIGLSPTTKNWNAFNTLTGMLVNNIGAPVAGSVAEAVNLTSRVFEGVVKGGIDAGAQVLKNFGVEPQQANDIARDALGPLEIEAGRGGEIPLHEAAQTAREFTAARNVNAPIPQLPKPKATPADVMAAPDIDTAIAKASEAAQAEPYDIEAEGMKAEAAAKQIEQAAPAPVAAETPSVEPVTPEAAKPAPEAPAAAETEAPLNEEIPLPEAAPEGPEAEEPTEPTAPAFDRLKYLGKARGYVIRGSGSLKPDAVAKALGIEPEQAAQVMGALAAQRDSGLIVTANGTLRRAPTYSGPMDLIQWIGRHGGIYRDGDMEAMDAHRAQTGAGPVARAGGRDADYVREAVNQEGYGPYQTINDLYKAIDENLRGNRQFVVGEYAEDKPYDPVEHEHYLDQRASALDIERAPNSTLDQYDAAITEAEARRTPTHTLPEVDAARQAEIDEVTRGLLDEHGLEGYLEPRTAAEARGAAAGENPAGAHPPEPVSGEPRETGSTRPETESRSPDVAASGAASGTGEAGAVEPPPEVAANRKPTPKPPSEMIEDAGEKIGGARKDRWAERGLQVSDLADMSEGEAYQYTTKDQVWPKPDYAKLAEAGADPIALAHAKLIRDRLAAKPASDSASGRRDYIEMVGHVRDVLSQAKTVADVKRAADIIHSKIGWDVTPNDAAVRAKLFSVYKGRHSPLRVEYGDAKRAEELVKKGFPGQVEPWKRRYEIRERDGSFAVTKSGRYRPEAEGFPTRELAEAKAKELYRESLATGEGEKLPERPHLDKLQRTGADVRNGRDIDSKDFVSDFGFRGVEYGNWVASDERRKSTNLGYEALHDLAHILNIPPKAVSLDGQLGLAFGARGSGKFAAHYEPGKLVINLTKFSGAGSLAHEWGHALDHYFGTLNTDMGTRGAPKGASGWYTRTNNRVRDLANLRPEMAQAFDKLMSAMFHREKGRAEAVRDAELRVEALQGEIAKQQKRIDEIQNKGAPELRSFIKDSQKWIEQRKIMLDAAGAHLAKLRDETAPYTGAKVNSSYYREGVKLSGKSGEDGYWTRPTELFARAFESYVFDKIKREGNVSDYLVQGVEPDRYKTGYKGNPYPEGAERDAINAAFDHLFQTMQTEEREDGRVAMFARDAAQRARDSDQFAGRELQTPEGTTLRYTPAFESARAKVGESLRAELERRGFGSIAVRMADSIRNGDLPANGYYLRKIMTVALQSTSDHMAILDHELIHALRDMGLFTKGEWRILELEARRKWLNQYADKLKGYPDTADKIEEAVAFAAMDARSGASGFAQRMFERVRDFFRSLGNALKGNGFATPESIFRGIREGEFGERLKQGEATRAEPKFARSFEDMVAEHRALIKTVSDTFRADARVTGKREDITRLLTHGMSGEPFRVTSFRDGEPIGHREYQTIDEAAREFAGFDVQAAKKPITTEPGAPDARGKPLPQTVMPGMERSAKQLQAAKGTESKIKPTAPQKEAGGLFAAKEPPQSDLFGTKPKFAMRGEEEQIHDQVSDLIRAAAGEGATGNGGKGPSITERDLPRIALAGIKQVKNLNLPESGTIFPRTIASLDDLSAKLWNAWGRKTEKANANVEQLRSVISDSLTQLPAESRDRVYAAIELARKWNWRPADNDAPIRVRNSSYWQAQKSKIGDDFVLSPAEAKAFRDTLKLGDDGWRMFMQALARREGWTGEVDPHAIREAANSKSALPEGKKLLRLANALESAAQAMNRPYFPAARFGDYYIAVRPKSGVDKQSLGGFPEVEWFQTVEGSALDNMLGRSRKAPENVQAVNDAIAKIRAITKPDGSLAFPEETHLIETGDLHRSSDTLRQLNIPAIEKLFMLMERGVTENLTQKIMGEGDGKEEARTAAKGAYEHLQGEAKDALLDAIYEDLQAGFKKQARLVPGYSPDFDRAIGSHLGHIARNAADMEHREEIDSAYQNIQDNHPHQAVKDYWRHWREYQESPRASLMGPIGSMSRLGATYVMGLNPSTTLMISAHTPMMAAPVMGVGGNMGQATAQLMRSLREAYGSVTFDAKQGASIASENLGKNTREKALIAELDKAGLTHSTGADDVRAINDRQAGLWGKAAPTMKKALDISMSNISVVDQANRNAIALAVFRMALNKPTLEKMAAPWMEHNAIFRDMVIHDGLTPENFTKFMLSEAAGHWGRTNQAHVMRGAEGSLLFALHGFQTRYLSTVFKLAKNMGPEGKIAAGWMMAALWFGAGAYGLPFTQDLETAGDALLKRINGVDPMIDAHIRQFLSDVGFGKIGTEVLLRGPLSVALGTDLSSRIGFGDVITRISGLSDFMGTIPSIVLGRLNAAYDRERNGQGTGAALAELLPSALRNPVRAAIESSEGALSATGRKEVTAQELTTGDTVRRAIGLPPMSVEQAYARNEYLGRLSKRDQVLREQTVNSAAQMILHSETAAKNGDVAQAKQLSAQLSELLSSYNKQHWQAPVTSPELSNAILQLTNPELARKIKMPRALAGETWANPYP